MPQFLTFLINIRIFVLSLVGVEDSVKELQRKRHSATPDVSFKGRVRKAAKWKPSSDDETDEDSECKLCRMQPAIYFLCVLKLGCN